jgi:hypothetical protein
MAADGYVWAMDDGMTPEAMMDVESRQRDLQVTCTRDQNGFRGNFLDGEKEFGDGPDGQDGARISYGIRVYPVSICPLAVEISAKRTDSESQRIGGRERRGTRHTLYY